MGCSASKRAEILLEQIMLRRGRIGIEGVEQEWR